MNGDLTIEPPKIAAAISNRNKKRVLSEIVKYGPMPRTEIARRLEVTDASVSRIVRGLLEAGLIVETGSLIGRDGPGRRRIGLRVSEHGGYVAAIAINVFRQDVVVANIANQTLASKQLRFSKLDSPSGLLRSCAKELNLLIDETGIDRRFLFGCGIVLTGAVDPVDRRIFDAVPIGWHNVDAHEMLDHILGMPFAIENIPNAKNLAARHWGSTRSIDNVILFNCALGIGCSIMSEGRLLRGRESNVGVIESLKVPDQRGKLLPINAMAGGFAVINQSMDSVNRDAKLEQCAADITQAIKEDAQHSPVPGGRSLKEAGHSLGFAIMVANAYLHPQRFLLSGPMIESAVYREAVVEAVADLVDKEFAQCKLEFATLTNRYAAQSLAIYHFLTESGFAATR